MRKHFLLLSTSTALFLLSGCGITDKIPKPSLENTYDVSIQQGKDGSLQMVQKHQLDANKTVQTTTDIVKPKKKEYEKVPNFLKKSARHLSFSKTPQSKKIEIDGKNAKVSVEDIPLNEFIDLIFGSVLKTNYTVSQDVSKITTPVTLNMQKKQPAKKLFEVVKTILEMHGVGVTQKSGVFFISKEETKKEISNTTMFIGYGRKVPAYIPDNETIMMFVPYYYVNPGNTGNLLRQAGLKRIKFFYYIKNMQIMEDSAKEVRKALKMISLLDTPPMQNLDSYLINFQYIDAAQFVKRLKTIFTMKSISISPQPSNKGMMVSTIPEINSILAISPKKEWIDMLLYWKEKLDVPSEVSTEPEFYVYKVRNRKADDLAKILSQVLKQKNSVSTSTFKKGVKKTRTTKVTSGSIMADLPTNTIMMELTPMQYRNLLPIIKQLDCLPLQVIAEVTIAEVTLTNNFSLGFEYALKNDKALEATPFELAKGSAVATLGGSGFSAILQAKHINTKINAFAEKKLLNIVSKPKLMMLNNKSGSINVGQQVPILVSNTSSTELKANTQQISYRNTGVNLTLTPTINSNGVVTMKISLNLSEAQLNSTSNIDSPLIVNRTLSTTLTIKDNQTILLGGLISTNKSKTKSGVPILKDIPWVGNLFASQGKNINKTELIMLIKPQIIKTNTDVQAETLKYKQIMKLLNKYSN